MSSEPHYGDSDPALTAQLLAVSAAGIDFELYFDCLVAGATHDEVIEAAQWEPGGLSEYTRCRRSGATHGELAEYTRDGSVLRAYQDCRSVGATHGEIMEILALGGGGYGYCAGRYAGATHDELVAALKAGLPTGVYAGIREHACHQEALEVATWPVSTGLYLDGLERGDTHGELRDVVTLEVWREYHALREAGVSHGEIIALVRGCPNPSERRDVLEEFLGEHTDAVNAGQAV